MSAIDNDTAKGRVTIKRRRYLHKYSSELVRQLFHDAGKIALQMDSQSQEIRYHQNLRSSLTGKF